MTPQTAITPTKPVKLSLSPSAASRWLHCQASPRFIAENADRLPNESSAWADEGTIAHKYAAESLMLGWDEDVFKPEHKDMIEPVKVWHDYVRSHITSERDTLLIEQKLPLFYQPSRNGITDACVINRDEDNWPTRIVIPDYKHGAGVTVEAVGNPQLVIYAVNVIRSLDVAISGHVPIKLAIVQPRCREGEKIKEWELTMDELREEAEKIEAAATTILTHGAISRVTESDTVSGEVLHDGAPEPLPFYQSEKTCQFCPAQALCPTYAKAALAEVPGTVVELPEAGSLTIEQLGRIKASAGTLKKFLGAVDEYLLALGNEGKLPESSGYKLVAGKSNRAWSDEEEAQRLLVAAIRKVDKDLSADAARDRVAPRKIISPSGADDLLKPIKDDLSSRMLNSITRLIVKPEGAPTLAPLSDKRPSINPVSDFADISKPVIDESLL